MLRFFRRLFKIKDPVPRDSDFVAWWYSSTGSTKWSDFLVEWREFVTHVENVLPLYYDYLQTINVSNQQISLNISQVAINTNVALLKFNDMLSRFTEIVNILVQIDTKIADSGALKSWFEKFYNYFPENT